MGYSPSEIDAAAAAGSVAGADDVVYGGDALADGLAALHALRPGRRPCGFGLACSRRTGSSRHGPAAGSEALAKAGCRAPERADSGREAGLDDAGEPACAISGRGATGDCGGAASAAGDHPAGGTNTTCGEHGTSRAAPGHRKPRSHGGAGAELRATRDQAVGDSRAEDGEAKQRKRREDQGQRIADGGRVVKAVGELPEDRRADADDHGEHQHLHTGRDHVAQHFLGEEGGAAEEAERHQDESGQGGQLELDQTDEKLNRHNEKADDDDQPGDQQDGDLDEVVEEAGEAHQPGNRVENGLAGSNANLGEPTRLKELRLAHRPAARLDAESGEGIVDDLGEVVEIADDEGEDADIERLLDQPREHILIRGHRPEEPRQCDVDGDQHAGQPTDVALHETEAGIEILREDAEEVVDDAGAAHAAY
jgi:hypothetical protein